MVWWETLCCGCLVRGDVVCAEIYGLGWVVSGVGGGEVGVVSCVWWG